MVVLHTRIFCEPYSHYWVCEEYGVYNAFVVCLSCSLLSQSVSLETIQYRMRSLLVGGDELGEVWEEAL
jgi:hypothetical protein